MQREKASKQHTHTHTQGSTWNLLVHGMRGDLVSPVVTVSHGGRGRRYKDTWDLVGGVPGREWSWSYRGNSICRRCRCQGFDVWGLGVGSSCSRCTWSVRSNGIVFPQVRQWQLAKSGNHQAAARSVGSSGISRLWISVQQFLNPSLLLVKLCWWCISQATRGVKRLTFLPPCALTNCN